MEKCALHGSILRDWDTGGTFTERTFLVFLFSLFFSTLFQIPIFYTTGMEINSFNSNHLFTSVFSLLTLSPRQPSNLFRPSSQNRHLSAGTRLNLSTS